MDHTLLLAVSVPPRAFSYIYYNIHPSWFLLLVLLLVLVVLL